MDPLLVIAALLVAAAAVVLLRASRRQAAQSVAELQTVLGVLDEAVIVQRPDGALVYANEAAARMLGLATPRGARRRRPRAGRAGTCATSTASRSGPRMLPGRRALRGRADARPPLLLRVTSRDDRRGLLAARQGVAGARRRRPPAARRQRHRGPHRGAPRRDRAALPGAGEQAAVLVARRRRDARQGRVGGGARARRLVRGRHARRARAPAPRRHRRRRACAAASAGAWSSARARGPARCRSARRRSWRPGARSSTRDDRRRRCCARPRATSTQLEALRAVGRAVGAGRAAHGRRPRHRHDHPRHDDRLRPPRSGRGELELAEELGPPRGRRGRQRARARRRARTIATTLQEALLPPRLPVIPGLADRRALPRRGRGGARSAATSTTCSPVDGAGWCSSAT